MLGHNFDADARRYERIKKDLNEIALRIDKEQDSHLFYLIAKAIDEASERYAYSIDKLELYN